MCNQFGDVYSHLHQIYLKYNIFCVKNTLKFVENVPLNIYGNVL